MSKFNTFVFRCSTSFVRNAGLSVFAFSILTGGIWLNSASAYQDQDFEWRVITDTVYEEVPEVETKLVQDTEYVVENRTTYKPVWNVEKRERRVVTRKPVVETKERIETQTLLRPVTVTKYREKEVRETVMREVTRYRDETFTVREPVVETELREETRVVRKPVTETMLEVKKTTSFKPITETKTEYVADPGTVGLVVQPDLTQRPRLSYLTPGYYTDPVTGATVYRRRGLHWVAPNTVTAVAQTPPSIVPLERTETRYVPETIEERRPIEITRMEESTETRKVPVEVRKMVERTETRRVPYTVVEPVVVTRVERVPYTVTEYKEEVLTKRVPYQETVIKEEVTFEPYEVEVGGWQEKIEKVEVAKPVERTVERKFMKRVPKTVIYKVKVGPNGEYLSKPVPYDPEKDGIIRNNRLVPADQAPSLEVPMNEAVGSTTGFTGSRFETKKATLENQPNSVLVQPTEPQIRMKPISGEPTEPTAPSKEEPSSEVDPESVPSVSPPPTDPSQESGDENAADRVRNRDA